MMRKIIKKMKRLTHEEIEFISQSNAIEGEFSKKALDDATKAWRYALKLKDWPITPKEILKIHKILMRNLEPEIAGKIRDVPVWIGGKKRSQSKEEIEDELRLLCNPGLYPILSEKFIKDWHVRFEEIHPFVDSNGRTGRILMNLQRIKIGLPILIILEKEKYEYYNWFG